MSTLTTIGTEFQVNTTTFSHQNKPAMAALSNGGFVIVWKSKFQDGSDYGVFAQRYDSSGTKDGAEFQVNVSTSDDQENADVVAYDNHFAVVWESFQSGVDDAIYSRVFVNDLSTLLPEQKISTTYAGTQVQPNLAVNGNTLAVWSSADAKVYLSVVNNSSHSSNIEVASGVPVFAAPTITGLEGASSKYVISYTKSGSVYAKIVDISGGISFSSEFSVGSGNFSSVTSLSNGRFVVVSGSSDIVGRVFNSAGSSIGDPFVINKTTADSQIQGDVTALSDGGFFVVWSSNLQDGDSYGIFGQRFTASGRAIGQEIQINTTTEDGQYGPKVVELDNGNLVVTWFSNNQDGDGAGVFAQIFSVPVAAIDQELTGTSGNDLLVGAEGFDTIRGFGGNDVLRGLRGDDTLKGDAGNDRLYGGKGKDALIGGSGNDRIDGGTGNDRIQGGGDNDIISGGSGRDRITGNSGIDMITGGDGNDIISGGSGYDFLEGNQGNDKISGDEGDDILSGGTGADTFKFRTGDGTDRITDFEDGIDSLQIISGANSIGDVTILDLGADALVVFSDVVIRLENLDHALLDTADFVF